MTGFLLFLVSFIMVLLSSYFIVSLLKEKNTRLNVLYLILTIVSQVLITFELLSLFKGIAEPAILAFNLFILSITFILWNYKQRPLIGFHQVYNHIIVNYQALKKDKLLLVISIFFVFSCAVSLFLAFVTPVNSWDSMDCYLARIPYWIQHRTLAHYEASVAGFLIFPFASEILILWSMIFTKNDIFAQLVEYLSYLGCLFILYNFLSYFRLSKRRILWAVFILGSIPSLILESASQQTNLVIAFFIFCSFFLFIYGVKEKNNLALIYSAISIAIGFNTKNSIFFFIPVFSVIYPLILIKERGKDWYKPLIFYISVFIPALIILSSYNYIQNYFSFGNFFGFEPFVKSFNIKHNVSSFLANLIRNGLLFFDFSGIPNADKLTPLLLLFKNSLFNFLSINHNAGLITKIPTDDISSVNTVVHESFSTFGLIGFILILPMMIKRGLTGFFSRNRTLYISMTAFAAIGFLFALSCLMGFKFCIHRYITTAVIFCSPILIFTYKKTFTPFKLLITGIVIWNFIIFSTANEAKPLFKVINIIKDKGFVATRDDIRYRFSGIFDMCLPYKDFFGYIKKTIPDNSKIALFYNNTDWYYPFFETNSKWKIYPLRYELFIKKKNFRDFDYIILSSPLQKTNIFDDKHVSFNYSIDNGVVNYNVDKAGGLIYVYENFAGEVIDHGVPASISFKINSLEIEKYFNLIKIIPFFEKKNFYIYRKKQAS